MNKIEKVFQVISWIVIVLGFAMITWFIVMCIMLARYNKCQDTGFQPTYCEKYKNFKEEKIMERDYFSISKPKGSGGYLINLTSLGGVA